MKSPDKEPEYEDLTPSWEVTAQMLLLIIKEGTDLENKQWAESEVLRMGRIGRRVLRVLRVRRGRSGGPRGVALV